MTGQLVWLITGTSAGLGKDLALAALKRGEKVIATTRGKSVAKLADLKAAGAATLELDVTAPLPELKEIAKKAIEIYGHVDVLVNNAAHAIAGTIEDVTPEETYEQYNANVFGALNVTRAFLPYMRARKSGTIIWAGSIVAWQPVPVGGIYCSTKYAIRGIAQTLHAEIAPLGMRSICIDIGYFRTALLNPGVQHVASYFAPDYKDVVEKTTTFLANFNGNQTGDPAKAGTAIIDIVRGEGLAAGREVPTVIPLGSDCYATIKASAEAYLKANDEWKDLIFSTDVTA